MSRFRLTLGALFIVSLFASCTEDPSDDEPVLRTIYVSGEAPWIGNYEIGVNGRAYPASPDARGICRVDVPSADEYYLFYPCTGDYKGEGIYATALPSVQHYFPDGPDPAAALCTDHICAGGFSFETGILSDITAVLEIKLYARGTVVVRSVQLSSGAQPICGEVLADCKASTLSAGGQTATAITLDCNEGVRLGTAERDVSKFYFRMLPGDYGSLRLVVSCADGSILEADIPGSIGARSGRVVTTDPVCLSSSDLTSLNVSLDGKHLGTVPWETGTALNVNGTTTYAISSENGVLSFPVSAAPTYRAVYPATADLDREPAEITGTQPYSSHAPTTEPHLRGSCNADDAALVLHPSTGVLRLKLFSADGITRKLKRFVLSGDGINIAVESQEPLLQDPTGGTGVCFVLPTGTYKGLKLSVDAFDASFKIPYELGEEDLYVRTDYEIADVNVGASSVALVQLQSKVVPHEWMRANGTPQLVKEPTLDESLAAFINTGYMPEAGRGVAVEYEAVLSGVIYDFRSQKAAFGAYGSGSNKTAAFMYNPVNESGWYHIMACVAGMETYKQEKDGRNFHIDKALADKRVVQIGCEGVLNSSYIYARWKNLDRGDTQWTDLYEKSSYFLFSAGNLRCNFPIILFALNKQGKVSAPNNEIAIHRFTIRYGGQTVMELTPCTVDGIPAMHDSVQDKFFFNASKSVQIVTKNGCYSPLEVGD